MKSLKRINKFLKTILICFAVIFCGVAFYTSANLNTNVTQENVSVVFAEQEIEQKELVDSSEKPTAVTNVLSPTWLKKIRTENPDVTTATIVGLSFVKSNVIPNGYTGKIIVAEDETQSIFASYKAVDGNFDVVIWSSSVIYFPANSSELFGNYSKSSALYNATSLTFDNVNTSNVTDMSYMFMQMQNLQTIDLSMFNTANVADMDSLFAGCEKLNLINFGKNFNTSKTTTFGSLFLNCYALTTVDVSMFNTSNATGTVRMFAGCRKLTTLDLSNFDMRKVRYMQEMFRQCYDLQVLTFGNYFITDSALNMEQMFRDCYDLESLDLSKFNTTIVTNMNSMFEDCNKLEVLDWSNFNTKNVTDMSKMFYSCSKLNALDLKAFNTTNVTDMSSMFANCRALTSLNISNFNTSKVTNMSSMFYRCLSLNVLDLSNFNTSKVINMSSMFYCCESLNVLDLSSFNTAEVTDMSNMFAWSSNLTSVDVSSFNTTNVTNMSSLFNVCIKLSNLDVSNFNTSNVVNMESMFYACESIKTINVSHFKTTKVQNMASMFYGCENLTSLDLSNFDLSSITTTYAFSIIDPAYTTTFVAPYNLPDAVSIDVSPVMFIRDTATSLTTITNEHTSKSANDKRTFVSQAYKIILKDCGGADYSGYSTYKPHVYGAETILRNDYKRGYEFLGWYLDINCEGTPITSLGATQVTSDITIYAKWQEVNYNLTLEVNNSEYGSFDYPTTISLAKDTFIELQDNTLVLNLNDGQIITITAIANNSEQYICEFVEWLVDGESNYLGLGLTKATTITAVFKATEKEKYTITWKNYDGTLLITETYFQGQTPSYKGATPTKPADAEYSYSFKGWTPTITEVTENATYIAEFEQVKLVTEGTLLRTWFDKLSSIISSRNSVTAITFAQAADIPSGYTGKISVGVEENTVFVSYKDTDGKYDLVIWAPYTIYLPANSNNIFANFLMTKNINFGNINTSRVTNMNSMFSYTLVLTNLDLSIFVTTNVTDMSSMFANCRALTSLNISNFNTSKVTNMKNMFYDCRVLTSLNISNFNTSKVTNMSAMFKSCRNLTSLDLINFNTSNVTDMSSMFAGTTEVVSGKVKKYPLKLNKLNLSKFDTSKVTNMNSMFYLCSSLTELNISSFNLKSCLDVGSLLTDCSKIYRFVAPFTSNSNTISIDLPSALKYYIEGNTGLGVITKATNDGTYAVSTLSTENNKVVLSVHYTVSWQNYDNSVLETDIVLHGTMPEYNSETPTKPQTAQYTYTFAGWTPEVDIVTKDVTYTATFTPTIRTYTVKWINENLDVLEIDENVPYGTMPTYDGAVPTKPQTAQYTYTFAGWTSTVVAVTGDVTYKATYNSELRKYTVTWKNYDGTILEIDDSALYDSSPSYDGALPTKPADAQYTYTFAGWTPEGDIVTKDVTYTATFTPTIRTYTVKWINENLDVLETDENVPYGTMPTYDGAVPTKPQTTQYTYTFAGWTPVVDQVTGNVTYTAIFTENLNKHTIRFLNYDGTVLWANIISYGVIPEYKGATPTKPADANGGYKFIGWTPEVVAVTGMTDYTATYISTHTVTWKNYDGTVLETDENVEYGTMPKYDGYEPWRAQTSYCVYKFEGWTPEIVAVTGNVEYTAVYTEKPVYYSVYWRNYNGDVLKSDSVAYGTMPVYNGQAPTKPATEQYHYVFSGWSPKVTAVTGNVIYNAVFTEVVNKYTVTWKNYDGTVLETDENVPYGTMPTYDGVEPYKAPESHYWYTFSGWTPEIVAVTGDITYTAVYSKTPANYQIVWKNYDGEVLKTEMFPYGTMPVYNGALPTKPADAQYTYIFAGWSPAISEVEQDGAFYTAMYTPILNKYTVTWKNYDGTILETDNYVDYGTTPTYNGTTPIKEIQGYTCTFTGWSPEVNAVSGNVTYFAQYSEVKNIYKLTIIYYMGEEVYHIDEKEYEYGSQVTITFGKEDEIKSINSEEFGEVHDLTITVAMENDLTFEVKLVEPTSPLLLILLVSAGTIIIGLFIYAKVRVSKRKKYSK